MRDEDERGASVAVVMPRQLRQAVKQEAAKELLSISAFCRRAIQRAVLPGYQAEENR